MTQWSFLFCLLNLYSVSAGPADDYQPNQVHIAWGETPLEIVVTWSTCSLTPNTIVEYGVGEKTFSEKGEVKVFIDGGRKKRKQYIHRVRLRNLKPWKRYVYHCGSELGISDDFWFNTVPDDSDWSPRVAVYGDMGVKHAVALPALQREAQEGMYDAFIHVGDFAYDMKDKNGKKGDQFMMQIQPIAAHVPYMVCPGNHEKAYNFSHFRERFSMPGPHENLYYSFNLGPAHFISINTEAFFYLEYGLKLLSNMYDWLEQDLKTADSPENRKVRPWIITYGHRPMYCSNTNHGCETRNSVVRTGLNDKLFGLEEMFFRYGVDLSMWGHEHSYERLWPVYNNTVRNGSLNEPYINPEGPVHITTGTAGCWEPIANFSKKPQPWSAMRLMHYGYTRLQIHNASHLHISEVAVDEDEEIVDDVWIVKYKHRYGKTLFIDYREEENWHVFI